MPKIAYVDKRFTQEHLGVIEAANKIIEEYQGQGFVLTLRQLYYQFVSRALIPNRVQEYKRLGSIINDGRLAGLIDWDAIEDRGRNLITSPHWTSPAAIVDACAAQYHEDHWAGQKNAVEVWIEKDALSGVVAPACRSLDIPYFACRGYNSQSEQWAAGQRIAQRSRRGQRTIVLHLGDHDPSGIDMTRDNRERLALFAGSDVLVERLALNFDQVEEHKPPPNPAKTTDARFAGYASKYGDESWELDALEPRVIDRLIRAAVADFIDQSAWDAVERRIQEHRSTLAKIGEYWPEVVDFIENIGEEERHV